MEKKHKMIGQGKKCAESETFKERQEKITQLNLTKHISKQSKIYVVTKFNKREMRISY